ncbi:unnamed protein product [Adineta ricciae]|uniref:Glycosyltransferase family 92 protein n=1 Tax=Adineta ricciae TaxID=249248 RepID=A0A815UWN9_ADIRI|nr:unnamed protein product [Adineta ricciae]CAF1521939.1 unnamed protein product [Adineta ricciae]
MINRFSPPPIHCQLWFANLRIPVVTSAIYHYSWRKKWGYTSDEFLQPYLITCPIRPANSSTNRTLIPKSVSLIETYCSNATNNLPIRYNQQFITKKEDFAVCVKGLDFMHTDISVRLVEWIELLYILGVKKIFFYQFDVHPNISKVLNYYQSRQLVQVTKISLPGTLPNLPGLRHSFLESHRPVKRQNEIIPYNDCLYNNLYSVQYIIPLDTDEIIIPLIHQDWSQLMTAVRKVSQTQEESHYASYEVRSVYFFDDVNYNDTNKPSAANISHTLGIPSYLHMLQHVYRSGTYLKVGWYAKSFFNTDHAVTIHNHILLNCFGRCTKYRINNTLAHVQHYRKDCVKELQKVCQNTYRKHILLDTSIWKYKAESMQKTSNVLTQLGLLTL